MTKRTRDVAGQRCLECTQLFINLVEGKYYGKNEKFISIDVSG